MRSTVAGLSTGLPPALLAAPSLTWLPCQSIGRRGFGGVRGVLFAERQLALQIRDLLLSVRDFLLSVRDLLLSVRDLLVAFRYAPPEFLILSEKTLILLVQFLMAELDRVPMALPSRPSSRRASRSRIHPAYVDILFSQSPGKSNRVPELLPRHG